MGMILNDFRNALGKVNDGNLILDGNGGVKKVNFGRFIIKEAHASNGAENQAVRRALFDAIRNSQEGKLISAEVLDRICRQLGVDGAEVSDVPLSRRTLKQVLDCIDHEIGANGMVERRKAELTAGARDEMNVQPANGGGAGNLKACAEAARREMAHPALKDAKSMLKLLPKGDFLGHSHDQVAKVVANNFAKLRGLIFDEICWGKMQHGAEKRAGEVFLRSAMRYATEDLMTAFAEKREVLPLLSRTMRTVDPEIPELAHFENVPGMDDEGVANLCKEAGLSDVENALVLLSDMRDKAFGHSEVRTQRQNNLLGPVLAPLREQMNEVLRMSVRESLENRADYVRANSVEIQRSGKLLLTFASDLLTLKSKFGDAPVKNFLNGHLKSVSEAATRAGGVNNLSAQQLRDLFMAEVNKFESRHSWREQARTAFSGVGLPSGADAGEMLEVVMERLEKYELGNDVKYDLGKLDKPDGTAYTRRFFDDQVVWAHRNNGPSPAMRALVQGIVNDVQSEKLAELEATRGKQGVMSDRAEALVELLEKDVPQDKQTPKDQRALEGLRRMGRVWLGPEADTMSKDALIDAFIADEKMDFGFAFDFVRFGFDEFDAEIAAAAGDKNSHPVRDLLLDMKFDMRKFNDSGALAFGNFLRTCALGRVFRDADFFPEKNSLQTDSTQFAAMLDLVCARAKAAGRQDLVRLSDLKPAYEDFKRQVAGIPDLSDKAILGNAVSYLLGGVVKPIGLNDKGLKISASDFGMLMKVFAQIGLKPEDFNLPEKYEIGAPDALRAQGREKAILVVQFASKNPTGLFGLDEYCRRVVGKPLSELTVLDAVDTLPKLNDKTLSDPAMKLSEPAKKMSAFLGGSLRLGEAKLPLAELSKLLTAARAMVDRPKEPVTATVDGVTLTLSAKASGELTAMVNGLPMPVFETSEGLLRSIEDVIARQAGDPAAKDAVLDVLPPLPDKKNKISPARARELYTKALAAKTGELGVTFATLPLENLRALVLDALNGANDVPNRIAALKGVTPKTFSGTDVVEMRLDYEQAIADGVKMGDLVKVAPQEVMREIKDRQRETRPKDVSNLVADLLMNGDTWGLDEAEISGRKSAPGARLRNLIAAYRPELDNIRNDPALLDTLPDVVREPMKALMADLAAINLESPDAEDKLVAAEGKLAKLSNEAMDTLQGMVSKMFPAAEGDDRPVYEKSFSEITGAKGLDKNTPAGAFAKKVLDGYFKNSDIMDKRKMLSAVVRNVQAGASSATVVAELLKGAGPLLQKLLQGLPAESFNKETQEALKDMKSRLPPIPADAVNVLMYSLVKNSGGKILSVEVKQTLGAASVGQALLCNLKTPEHPVAGVDCVVKLLRPNAMPLIAREKKMIDALAGVTAQERNAFQSHFESVLEELDLTIEAANVDVGVANYETPVIQSETSASQERELSVGNLGNILLGWLKLDPVKDFDSTTFGNVHSMSRLGGIPATANTMVVKKAPGKTVDGLLRKTHDEAQALMKDLRKESAVDKDGNDFKVTYEAKSLQQLMTCRTKLADSVKMLVDRRNAVENAATVWMEKALFGDGFFHGDLHAGNVMVDEKGLTLIDFGNCSRLTSDDQKLFRMMLIHATVGKEGSFLSKFDTSGLDENARGKLEKQLHVVLNKGTASDVLSRMHCALTLMQQQGIPVPKNISNFINSFVRLNGVLTAMDDEIDQLTTLSSSIVVAPPVEQMDLGTVQLDDGKGNKREVPSLLALLATVPSALNDGDLDDNGLGYEVDRLLAKHVRGKPPYSLLTEFKTLGREKALAALNALVDMYAPPGQWTQVHVNGMREAMVALRDNAVTYFDKLEAVEAAEKQPIRDENALGKLAGELREAEKKIDLYYRNLFVENGGAGGASLLKKGLQTLAVPLYMPPTFDEIVSSCVEHHSVSTVKFAYDLLSFREFKPVGEALSKNQATGQKTTSRAKNVVPVMAQKNAAAPKEERLSPGEMRQLRKLAKDFCAPTKRPYDGNDGTWATKNENRTALFDMLGANLRRLRQVFGDKLEMKHVKYAFAIFSARESTENLNDQSFHSVAWSLGALPKEKFGELLASAESYGKADPALVNALNAIRALEWHTVQ